VELTAAQTQGTNEKEMLKHQKNKKTCCHSVQKALARKFIKEGSRLIGSRRGISQ
jgi:hypothetical protein